MHKIDLNGKTILVTGHAGFIGSNLVNRLFHEMKSGTIVGIDNLNSYYDTSLKIYRLDELDKAKPAGINFISVRGDIADKELIDSLFAEHKFDIVVNLAAQAGVRYSIENPDAYIQSNIIGFYNILEACRHNPVQPRGTSCVCIVIQRVWRQQEGAVCGGGQGGQPRFALCRHQEE